jgi:hypothetical protein
MVFCRALTRRRPIWKSECYRYICIYTIDTIKLMEFHRAAGHHF